MQQIAFEKVEQLISHIYKSDYVDEIDSYIQGLQHELKRDELFVSEVFNSLDELGNENFIDTAIKRESVVSIAKALGYTPRSMRAAQAKVNLVVTPPSSYTSTTMQLDRGTAFSATVDGTTYKFYPNESVSTSATTAGGAGPYFLYGTHATLGKGFYCPIYLTEAAALVTLMRSEKVKKVGRL